MIYLGSDHRGFKKKSKLAKFLTKNHLEFEDLGPKKYDKNDDYNDAAIAVSKAIQKSPESFGILICGSAHGMVIQANRFTGIRAITATNRDLVKLGRIHNDANVLCLSADFLSIRKIKNFVKLFLETNFNAEQRLVRRNSRLDEKGNHD